MLVANAALSNRLDAIARAYLIARYSGPGNPMGAEFLRTGSVIAIKVPFVRSNALMNRATGITTPDELGAVMSFYGATRQTFWIEVTPATPVPVTDAMIASGFKVVSSASSLYAAPLPVPIEHSIDIDEVDDSLLTVFLDTMNTGFGTSAEVLESMRRNQRFWTTVDNWHLYLARVDGAPAAAAVLSMHGDVGYLAAASTLPAFRQHGLQTALIATRIARARALGATLITGQAEWGSSSQANMQRAGLQISHVRVLWSNAGATPG